VISREPITERCKVVIEAVNCAKYARPNGRAAANGTQQPASS
jgi:hypothetical protein